jgi:hypothetical protein
VAVPVAEHERFAYLLLTHKDPRHVEGLADRIRDLSPDALIVVHHDAAAPDLPWDGNPPAGIHLVERGRVSWGDWSMIEATQRLLRYALDRLDAGWFVLLSGEHRPALDLHQWESSTAAAGYDALFDSERLPDHLHFGRANFERSEYLARSRHRWRLFSRPRHRVVDRFVGLLMKLSWYVRPMMSVEFIHRRNAWAVGRRRRSHPVRGWSFYRGSQWFALNRRAASAALAIDRGVAAWFEHSWIPDEAFLHTALRQVPQLVVANSPTTFVLDRPAKPYPGWMLLSLEDLPTALGSGLPFVRKVDPATRPEVVESIDLAVDRQRAKRVDPSAASLQAPDDQREGPS